MRRNENLFAVFLVGGVGVLFVATLSLHGTPQSAVPLDVQVLGLFDSGTNLVQQELAANFPDLRTAGVAGCAAGGIWKHIPPAQVADLAAIAAMSIQLQDEDARITVRSTLP